MAARFTWDPAKAELKSFTLSRQERQSAMKRASTKTSSVKRLKISEETREEYGKRDPRLDSNLDAPQLPPDYWENATIGGIIALSRPRFHSASIMKFWIG